MFLDLVRFLYFADRDCFMFDFLLRPFRRNYGKDKMFYRAIDDMFGFIPNNIELYKLALIHKSESIVFENGQHINKERL